MQNQHIKQQNQGYVVNSNARNNPNINYQAVPQDSRNQVVYSQMNSQQRMQQVQGQQQMQYDKHRAKMNEAMRTLLGFKKTTPNNGDLKILPRNVSISDQRANEIILLYIRRHWSENIGWITRNIFYSLIPLVILVFLNIIGVEDLGVVTSRDILILIICYYSMIMTNLIRDFFDWYFDPYIVTNQRILHYEFTPFKRYQVREAMLLSVQKIKESAGGIISNIFGYGTLKFSIEGPGESIVMKNIPIPTKVRAIVSELIKIEKKYGD